MCFIVPETAQTKPSKKSHVLCVPRRPFPRFAALEIDRRPISDQEALPPIRLKIIDVSHVLEDGSWCSKNVDESWTRRERILCDFLLDKIVSINDAWIKRKRKNSGKYGIASFWDAKARRGRKIRGTRSVRGELGLGEISFDPIMPVLNAVHALLSSANVVTAIYQVTGQDLHGFKRRSNTFHGSALFTDTDRSITPTNKPIRLHLFDLRPRLFSLFLFF